MTWVANGAGVGARVGVWGRLGPTLGLGLGLDMGLNCLTIGRTEGFFEDGDPFFASAV